MNRLLLVFMLITFTLTGRAKNEKALTLNSIDEKELLVIQQNKADTLTINLLFDLYYKNRQRDPTKALECLQKALAIAMYQDNQDKIALLLYHKGYLYRTLGIHNLAIQSYLKSLEIYEKKGDKNLTGWLLIDIGNLYIDQKNNLNMALDHFERAKIIFNQLGNTIGIIVSDYSIGQAFRDRKELDKAIAYFKMAARLSRQSNEKRHEAVSLSFIGESYLLNEKPLDAQLYFKESYTISKEMNSREGLAESYQNFAGVAKANGNNEECINHYMRALSFLHSIPDQLGISKTLVNISTVYNEEGKLKEAISFAEKALMVADSNTMINQQQSILPLLAGLYYDAGQQEKAYSLLRRYTEIKESNVNKVSLQIQGEYESQLRQHETLLLKKEKQLQGEKIRKQKTVIYLSGGALVLFLVLSGMIFLKNKKLKESYQHLYKTHMELTKKEEELIDIKKESKYTRSTLKDEAQQSLLNELAKLMLHEKIFLNKDLNLDELAKRLGTNRTYLSQVINDNFNTNFNNYINEYRVKEAQRLLLNPSSKILTIEAIAQNVGFNSKSSFNTAFKKFTGLTPSDFINIKENTI